MSFTEFRVNGPDSAESVGGPNWIRNITQLTATAPDASSLVAIDDRLMVIDGSAFRGSIVMKRERIRDSSSSVSIAFQLLDDNDDGINLFSHNKCEGYTFLRFIISFKFGRSWLIDLHVVDEALKR